jgi:iron complex outermembrane receptor protein
MKHISLFAGSLFLLVPMVALAQVDTGGDDVEEVIVKGQFTSRQASSGTKQDIPVLETPFVISSYNDSFMKAIETREVADLYHYMNGVTQAGNTGYDMTIRGFQTASTDRNAIMTDGLPGLTVRFGSPPTIGTDHIDVVEGPASLLYGQSEPGGFINIVTKKPEKDAVQVYDVRASGGLGTDSNVNGTDVAADLTGPLNDSKTLLYRLIGQIGYDNTFRTSAWTRPFYIAPSLSWQIDDNTKITLQVEYRHTGTGYDSYLVAPFYNVALIPNYTTRYQSPTDTQTEDGVAESMQVTHDFGNDIKWNFNYRNVHHNDTAVGYDVVGFANTADTLLQIRARDQLNKRTYEFGDTNVTAPFDLFGIKNKLIVGADLGSETLEADRIQFYNIPTTGKNSYTLSVYNPSYAGIPAEFTFPFTAQLAPANLNDRYTWNLEKGAYISDYVEVTDWLKLTGGVRYTISDQFYESLSLPSYPTNSSHNTATSPVAGVVVEPLKGVSVYANYSTSFVPAPASNVDIHGNSDFVPTTGTSYEIGSKGDLLEGRIQPNVALFKIDKDNVLNTFTGGTCPASVGTCSSQLGKVEARGLELGLTATPLPHWQVLAGYTFTSSKVLDSTIANQVGVQSPNVPMNAAHLWTRYDIEGGALDGFGAGLGVSYTGQRVGLLPTATVSNTMPLPSYTVVDTSLYYNFDNISITFKISNLFNQYYIQSSGYTSQFNLLPGLPRTAALTLRTVF